MPGILYEQQTLLCRHIPFLLTIHHPHRHSALPFPTPTRTLTAPQCFCSADGDNPAELGTATCGQACTGNESQICGDRDAISVYQYVDTIIIPVPPTPSDDYVTLGCYTDLESPRVLTGPVVDNLMTTQVSFCFVPLCSLGLLKKTCERFVPQTGLQSLKGLHAVSFEGANCL